MSNYAKTVNFATKDGLSSGDPLKVVKGTEIDTEFNNIATMSATKQDSLPLTDATAIVFNSGDSTKKVRISAASVATGTTRVLTAQDLDGTIAILSQPATFTVLTATTSVVTPLVQASGVNLVLESTGSNVVLKINGTNYWQVNNPDFVPSTDNLSSVGTAGLRVKQVFTPTIDTGTTGAGVLKTNNGSTQITWDNNGAISIGGRASPASGAGIAFPATQSASTDVNTLDDYEEGTWTPSLGGTTTYTTQTGKYTKVGNLVFVYCLLQINAIGSGSTTVVSGLPFTSTADFAPMAVGSFSGSVTSIVSATAVVNSSNTTATIRSLTAAAAADGTSPIFGSGTILHFSGCYQAA